MLQESEEADASLRNVADENGELIKGDDDDGSLSAESALSQLIQLKATTSN